jgi:DNA-binding transcriptional LysR family regulator
MMELRHLRYFVAVAEELNFCRAAERLRIAQPPLSLQIRHLEEDLGAPLFNRVKRRLVLTPAGQTLLEESRRLLGDAEGVKRRVRQVARGEAGRLTIGYVGTAMYDVLPQSVRSFRERFPSVELALEEMSSAAQVHALRRGQIQLGVLRPPVNDEALESEDIVQESLMVALPENHRLCDKSHLRLTDLAGEAFVICSAEFEPSLYRCYTSLLKQSGFEPRIVQEVTHLQTQLGLVAAGMGVTLVPSSVARLPRPGIVYREASCPQVMLPKAAVWIKGLDSPQLKAFLAALRQTATHLQAAPLSIVANAM